MFRTRVFYLILLIAPIFGAAKNRDTLITYKLLQRIEQLQPKEDGIFPAGLFPSYRIYALNQYRQKADVNIFFTGLIAFTLRDIVTTLTPYQQLIAQRIIDKSLPVSDKFKNTKGRNTYHFWRTDDPQIFPNAGWLNWFNKSQSLPDDMDDTAIMLLAMAAEDTVVKNVHKLMQGYTNNAQNPITNTYPEYRKIGAYSTWFGVKMPVDFDVSVLSNVLLMVQRYQLDWTNADSASLELIVKSIQANRHLTDAAYISPHYSKPSIILYHISRLMAVKKIPALEALKTKLVDDALQLFRSSDSFMEQVILSTALLKWGIQPPEIAPKETGSLQDLIEDESFSFFIANMASMLPDGWKKIVGAAGLGKFYYFCPAYNNLLLLEYLTTTQR